jgi:hypothetical protein
MSAGRLSDEEREAKMLETLTADQARQIAALAQAARRARDWSLSPLAERELGEPEPARGEHNPAGAVGLEPLPPTHPARLALERAIAALQPSALSELRALVWLGRGEYAAKDWAEAVAAASIAPEAAIEGIVEEPDLHDLLIKGLYELALA